MALSTERVRGNPPITGGWGSGRNCPRPRKKRALCLARQSERAPYNGGEPKRVCMRRMPKADEKYYTTTEHTKQH